MQIEKIEFGNFYHIYSRGNNSQDIFFEEDNYSYFLKLLGKYIIPIANIYSYCLLKNHFHLVIKVKEISELKTSEFQYSTTDTPTSINPSKQFSHFFNAYTLAINKRFGRTGSLLEKPFERKLIGDENYLKQVILYINCNAKLHGLVAKVEDYKWSSFESIISNSTTKIFRDEVLEFFDGVENFKFSIANYEILNSKFLG